MPWDFRVDGHEKKLNPCTMDWAIFVVPTAQCERKVPIVDSLRFPSLGPSLGTIHHPEWRLPATNPMIQVICNFELSFKWRHTRWLPQLCTAEDAFPAVCAFLAPRVGDKSSFSRLPRFQRQEGGDVEKRKGWVKAWFTLLCSFVDLSACFGSQRTCDVVVAVINHNVSAPYNTILFMNLFKIAINTNCSVLHFSQLFCDKAE